MAVSEAALSSSELDAGSGQDVSKVMPIWPVKQFKMYSFFLCDTISSLNLARLSDRDHLAQTHSNTLLCNQDFFTSMFWLEVFPVHVHDFSMRLKQIVTAQVARYAWKIVSRCHIILAISLFTNVPRFVECRPNLDAIAKVFETDARVILKMMDHFWICPTTDFLQFLW